MEDYPLFFLVDEHLRNTNQLTNIYGIFIGQ